MFNPDGMLETYCGSPFYAAPEMIIGEKYVGPEVDVWSMGVILYTLLCGRLPFHDLVPRVLYERILSGNPEMPAFLSPASVDLMQRMMTVDREKRITLQEAMGHPWVVETYEGPPPSLVPARRPIGEIDRNILQQLPMYALDPRDAETQLRAPVMNAYMATYYLLLEKQERERAEALARRQQAEAQKRLHLAKQQELHQRQQAGWRNPDSADMDADEPAPAAAASPTTAAASPFTSFKGSQTVRSQRRARTLAGPASLELQRATAVASAVANALAAASTATAMAQLAVDQPASGRTTPVTPTSAAAAAAAAPSPAASMHVEPAVPRPGTPGVPPTAAAGHPIVHGGGAGPTVAAQVAQRAVYGTPVALPTAVPYTTVPAGPVGAAWTAATAGGAVATPHGYVPAPAAAAAAGQQPPMAMQWPLMSGRTLDASGRAAAARSRYHSTDPSRVEPIRRAVATYLAGANQGHGAAGAAGAAPGTGYVPPGAVDSAYMQAQNHRVFAAAVAAAGGGGAAGGVPTMAMDGGQGTPPPYDAAAVAAGGLPGDGPIGPGGLRTVGGLFSVETSSALPLAQVETELVRALESSGIAYTRDRYVFHCTYVPPPNPMQPPQPPLLFDAEICQIQRLELYGIRFCRLDGDIWLYKQAVQHIKAQLRL